MPTTRTTSVVRAERSRSPSRRGAGRGEGPFAVQRARSMILAATARLVAAQHTPYAHPATPEAACLERFLHYDYGALGRQIARLQSPVEWSTSLLEADPGARGLLVLPEESFDDAPPPAVAVALLEFTRRTLALLNALNGLLLLEHGTSAGGGGERPPQVSSVELTFRLRSPPEPYLLLHCDHEEHDPTTAVFTVGLSHGSQLSLNVRPGASVLYVRATRTSLLHAVRTRGAGQLAPRRHALYVRGTRTSLGRAERTMYHVPWHHRQPSHRAERLAEHHGVGRAVPRRVRRRGERRVRQRPCGCGHLPAAPRLPFAACGHCAPRCGRDPCALDDGAASGGGGGAHGARARSQVRRRRRSVLLQRTTRVVTRLTP